MRRFVRLLDLIRPHWPALTLVALALVVGTVLELTGPYLIRLVVDRAIAQRDLTLVAWLAAGYVILYVVRGGVAYLQWLWSERTGQKIVFLLRKRLHDHLQRLSHAYFAKSQTGQIMSRLTGDVESVQNFVGWGALLLTQVTVMIVAVTTFLFWLNWRLAFVTLITFPLLGRTVLTFQRRVRPAWERVREKTGRLTTVLQENVTGVRVVKAFAREPYEMGKFASRNQDVLSENMARAKIEAGAQPLMDFLSGLSVVFLMWYGGTEVLSGRMTLGSLFAFQGYLWLVIWPVRMLGWLVNDMEQALAAAPRIFEILDATPDITDRPGAKDLPPVTGRLAFEGVTFKFADADAPALSGLSLEIRPGEVVAVVGGTGSGKSTLINLLPRFHDVTEGRVTIDGHDVRDVTLASLRRQIGVVLQETFLFSATVKDNIAYGKPDAAMEEIIAVAKVAQAHEFIETLPKAYETRVGERGVGLSGGQKQRVALARALLLDPRILILDEATSSVDTETESLIQEGLEQAMRGRTTLIIAKRLSTVKNADRVLVLEEGRVTGFGTHEELLRAGGLYLRMFETQFGADTEIAAALRVGGEEHGV
jgi:ATP-binding cassette subfamily B multidrug efflux pump